jgi:ATP-dependent 26S proteasome regulatory subunit
MTGRVDFEGAGMETGGAQLYFSQSAHRSSMSAHIIAALEALRPLLTKHFCRVRELSQKQSGLQGLVVSESEVEDLLSRPIGTFTTDGGSEGDSLNGKMSEGVHSHTGGRSSEPEAPLGRVARLFGLTPFDVGAILISIAADLDQRFGLLYAYLQDDVTRRQPSVDFILTLLCDSFGHKLEQRQRFLPSAPLLYWDLLRLQDGSTPASESLLAKQCQVDARVIEYLLGSNDIDERLHAFVQFASSAATSELSSRGINANLIRHARRKGQRFFLHFQGPDGVGKSTAARVLSFELGRPLLEIDLERLTALDLPGFARTVRLIVREAILANAATYWRAFDLLQSAEKASWLRVLRVEVERHTGLHIFGGESFWEPSNLPEDWGFRRVEFSRPSLDDRLNLWHSCVPTAGRGADVDLNAIAQTFRLTGGQIGEAARLARELAATRDHDGPVSMTDLQEACRAQSSSKLSTLARKITPRRVWTDIILPEDRLQHLREICNAMKFRAKIYDQWGFEQKLSLGKGLNVLFAGPSGTGKTLAAEIMATELGLELYKIDLSSMVSKYIGETEKNLSHIFSEAENSNAILFFDEADALFGKRTEVRDSHDRYANIEVNYLLQKVEEYDGVVILATNFRRNMDDAFLRRMHFTVEFPFPDEADRLRIWQKIWPEATPRDELDLELMARRFEISGAAIRNIALSAAFLAASDGDRVGMQHLLHGARRECQKMGKVVAEHEFEIEELAETAS